MFAPKKWLILFVFLITTQKQAAAKDNQTSVEDIDFQAVLKIVDPPQCINNCIDGVYQALEYFFKLDTVVGDLHHFCSLYQKSMECVTQQKECVGLFSSYDVTTSGVKTLCNQTNKEYFAHNSNCVMDSLKSHQEQCESQCGFFQSAANYSHIPNLNSASLAQFLIALSQLANVCVAEQCYLPCLKNGVNKDCPNAGSLILESYLTPFYELSAMVAAGGVMGSAVVQQTIPQKCQYLLQKESLDKIIQANGS